MRVLMVSPYPPLRDGIAAYALQSVARLLGEGHAVEVVSPGPSAAHHHLDLQGWRGPLALARRVHGYDRVVLQYHPDLFYPQPCGRNQYLAISLGLALLFRMTPSLEVRVHETDFSAGKGRGLVARAVRSMWGAAPRLVVHSEAQRRSFHQSCAVPLEQIEVVDHGADFVPRTALDRQGARDALGIPRDQFMFLSIGFIQPHKGFDRAIRAFAGLGAHNCRLDVVGSVRIEEEGYLAHQEDLLCLAASTPGVSVHLGWVSDEEFDIWLAAADVVVLPYRHIWSSSVLERAALYRCRAIATDVGGLRTQARAETVIVSSDAALARAMWDAAGVVPSKPWDLPPGADAVTILKEVCARAREYRTGTAGDPDAAAGAGRASSPLRQLPEPAMPEPRSDRWSVRLVKRVAGRLTRWQVEPLYRHLNQLREASIETAERLAAGPGDDSH